MTLKEIGAALTELKTAISGLVTKSAAPAAVSTEELTKLKADATALQGRCEKLETDLKAEQTKAEDQAGKITKLEADLKTAQATISDPKGEIGKQAAAITASQGIPTAKVPAEEGPTGENKSLKEQYLAISDPQKRAEFWAKHRVELVK